MIMRLKLPARSSGPVAAALFVAIWLTMGGSGAAAPPAQLATPACFPETGYCTGGRIREIWERGGGLMVFGYPISNLQEELIEGQPRNVQWFERARIELHPDNPYPYDVQIGRVGADLIAQSGRTRPVAQTTLPGDCRSFAETGQSICGEFYFAWLNGGLELDEAPGLVDSESLALYGLPLTPPRTERLAGGGQYVVQWFERARFELHPQPDGSTLVLRGLLGRELEPVVVDPPGTPWAGPAPVTPVTAPLSAPGVLPGTAPGRLVIDAIGLNAPTVPVGTNEAGDYIVPNHEVGWYMGSATPGSGDNIVLWGHVLPFVSAPELPAPFARMKELRPGASITIIDLAGQSHRYVVTQQIRATPDQVGYILNQGRELVTLVSCIGEGIVAGGGIVDYTERLITIAEPAP